MTYALGDRVIFTDYLHRADLDSLIEERARMDRLRDFLTSAGVEVPKGRHVKVWVPESVRARAFGEVGIWIRMDRRAHPTLTDIVTPAAGVVVQKVGLQDGESVHSYEESAYFRVTSHRVGYRVAYHLSRRPLIVWPSMTEAAS